MQQRVRVEFPDAEVVVVAGTQVAAAGKRAATPHLLTSSPPRPTL